MVRTWDGKCGASPISLFHIQSPEVQKFQRMLFAKLFIIKKNRNNVSVFHQRVLIMVH
jgi:hypothetical protein